MGFGFDEVIEDRQELAHTGDDRNLVGLACCDEAFVESLDRCVASGGAASRHIKDVAKGASASQDAALQPLAFCAATPSQ